MVGTIDRPEPVALPGIASSAVVGEAGMLLYVRNGWIVAQLFDSTRRTLSDAPTLVAGAVSIVEAIPADSGCPFFGFS